MDKNGVSDMMGIIDDYGAEGALRGFIQALKYAAGQYSDMGLKERARAAVELAETLEEIRLDC